MKRLILIFTLIATTILPQAQFATAATNRDKAHVVNRTEFDDEKDDWGACGGGPAPTLPGGAPPGGDNEPQVWAALIATGIQPYQAAGIMGNMMSESGFDPHVIEGGAHSLNPADAGSRGYGLVQWTPGAKLIPYLNSQTPNITNEVAALMSQLLGQGPSAEKFAGDKFFGAASLPEATLAFEIYYERHAGPPQPARITQAEAFLAKYAPGAPSNGVGTRPGGLPGNGGTSNSGTCPTNSNAGCNGGDTVLAVPAGGKGTPTCYFNQAALSGGNYDWGLCGCLPTSNLIIRSTLDNNAKLDPVSVLDGLRSKGGIWSDGCSGVTSGSVAYLTSSGYTVDTVLAERRVMTDGTLANITQKLGEGYLILSHTSTSIDSAGTKPSPGHFVVIHAVDAQGNFYVANPGDRADNNKPISPDRIKVWLDMAIAVRK